MEDEVEPRIPYIRGDIITKKVTTWLESHVQGGNKPFFLWLHYMDVHEPYMPERKYVDMVDPSLSLSEDEMYDLFENTILKRDFSDPVKVENLKKLYDIHVREVDSYVQEFFGSLEKVGILKDCVVIFTNDHGDEFNDHGGLSHDDKMYSELIDTPLIIYGAGQSGEVEKLASTVDIAPTVMHLFGIKPVPAFKGHSLLPLENYPEKGIFAEAIDQRSQRGGDIEKDIYCYCEKDLKIIYRANLDKWEMYDLKQDPKEKNDIVDTSPEADKLKAKLRPMVRRWA